MLKDESCASVSAHEVRGSVTVDCCETRIPQSEWSSAKSALSSPMIMFCPLFMPRWYLRMWLQVSDRLSARIRLGDATESRVSYWSPTCLPTALAKSRWPFFRFYPIAWRLFFPKAHFHGEFLPPCYEIWVKSALHAMGSRSLPRSQILECGNSRSMEAVSCHEIALLAKTASVLRKAGRFRPPCHGGLAMLPFVREWQARAHPRVDSRRLRSGGADCTAGACCYHRTRRKGRSCSTWGMKPGLSGR